MRLVWSSLCRQCRQWYRSGCGCAVIVASAASMGKAQWHQQAVESRMMRRYRLAKNDIQYAKSRSPKRRISCTSRASTTCNGESESGCREGDRMQELTRLETCERRRSWHCRLLLAQPATLLVPSNNTPTISSRIVYARCWFNLALFIVAENLRAAA